MVRVPWGWIEPHTRARHDEFAGGSTHVESADVPVKAMRPKWRKIDIGVLIAVAPSSYVSSRDLTIHPHYCRPQDHRPMKIGDIVCIKERYKP